MKYRLQKWSGESKLERTIILLTSWAIKVNDRFSKSDQTSHDRIRDTMQKRQMIKKFPYNQILYWKIIYARTCFYRETESTESDEWKKFANLLQQVASCFVHTYNASHVTDHKATMTLHSNSTSIACSM